MKRKILIVDDDSSFRRILEYNLQEEGYEVLSASSGEAGLVLFKEQNPDLVVTDMKMEGISGIDLLNNIKKLSPDTLVIIITAFGAVEDAVEAMKLGAYDYITKPVNRDELKLVVQKALQLTSLSSENRELKQRLADNDDFKKIIGVSDAMSEVFAVIRKVADTEAAVLITGESGTGKELVAHAIHERSSRRASRFITINCAAIPKDLLESELFGHVKGAFTGAVRDQLGKFQQADGGTIFLDEIGEVPLNMQSKLLRVLQEKEIEPVGAAGIQKIDVRVITATNLDIEAEVAAGHFREDLYYRISVIPMHLPPLRQRPDDIPLLVKHFAEKAGKGSIEFSAQALKALSKYPWPGNVRELENTITRTIIMRRGDRVEVDDLPAKILSWPQNQKTAATFNLPPEGYPLDQLEKEVIIEALERNHWNKSGAAAFLKIPRHILLYRLEKYGISAPLKKDPS